MEYKQEASEQEDMDHIQEVVLTQTAEAMAQVWPKYNGGSVRIIKEPGQDHRGAPIPQGKVLVERVEKKETDLTHLWAEVSEILQKQIKLQI